MKKYCSIFIISLIFIQVAYSRPKQYENNSISSLIKILNIKGFTIKNEFPPIKGSYGMYETKTKTIWISPITKKLGIYENVLIHEAVHAAQSCPKGFLTKLDVSLNLTTFQEELIKRKLVSNYDYENFLLEKNDDSLRLNEIKNKAAFIKCSSTFSCPEMIRGNLTHFVSRKAFDIEGLGQEILNTFIKKSYLKDPSDIFLLQNFRKELENLEGLQDFLVPS